MIRVSIPKIPGTNFLPERVRRVVVVEVDSDFFDFLTGVEVPEVAGDASTEIGSSSTISSTTSRAGSTGSR